MTLKKRLYNLDRYKSLSSLRESQIEHLISLANEKIPISNTVIAISLDESSGYIDPNRVHKSEWQGLAISVIKLNKLRLFDRNSGLANVSMWLDSDYSFDRTFESIIFDGEYSLLDNPYLIQQGSNSFLYPQVNITAAELFLVNTQPWFENFTEEELTDYCENQVSNLVGFYEKRFRTTIDPRLKRFSHNCRKNVGLICSQAISQSVNDTRMIIPIVEN